MQTEDFSVLKFTNRDLWGQYLK